MDPINIFVGLNIIATFAANLSGAKSGLKDKLVVAKDKPKTYLQKLPLFLSAFTLVGLILGVFQVGTLGYGVENENTRLIGLAVYIIFSWRNLFSPERVSTGFNNSFCL